MAAMMISGGLAARRFLCALAAAVTMMAAAMLTAPAAARQCTTTVCDVTTQTELQNALNCLANPTTNTCSHIRVPSGTTLVLTSGNIFIGAPHTGLHLEVAGALEYQGPVHRSEKIFRLEGASNVLFDGGGLITSVYDPYLHDGQPDPDTEPEGIAKALDVTGDSSGITIENLTVTDLTSVLEVESGITVTNLSVTNVHVERMTHYGFFVNDRSHGQFKDCSVNDTIIEHPFRLYSVSGDLTVENCWSYNSGKTGLWILEGEDVVVDRFSSDQRLQFGPDHGDGSPVGARLFDVFARELESDDHVRIQMGVIGGCLVNMCSSLIVGRPVGDHVLEPNRPMDDVNWDEFSGNFTQVANPNYGPNVQAVDYDYCFADVDRNHDINVDDLVFVILNWGECPTPPPGVSGPNPPCAADIAPIICGNHTIDVDDLLLVILTWGGCPANPMCGNFPAVPAGPPSSPPETVDDCWDRCSHAYPEGGDDWAECFEACVQALEEMEGGG